MPGRICAIATCNNNQAILNNQGIYTTFHYFPKGSDSESCAIRKEWIKRCRRADKFNVDTSTICSSHFTPNDYERDLQNELLNLPLRKVLKKTAVPTINLRKTAVPTINFKKTLDESSKESHQEKRTKRKMNRDAVKETISSTTHYPNMKNSNENVHGKTCKILENTEDTEEIILIITDPTTETVNYKQKYEQLLQKYNYLKQKFSKIYSLKNKYNHSITVINTNSTKVNKKRHLRKIK